MTTTKPFGVTATAIYSAFGGIISLPVSLLLVFSGSLPKGQGFLMGIGGLLMALGVLLLASVYGLWSLQEWGRKLTIWLYIISAVLGIIVIFPILPKHEFTIGNTILQLVGIGVDILIVSYLSKSHIKTLFN